MTAKRQESIKRCQVLYMYIGNGEEDAYGTNQARRSFEGADPEFILYVSDESKEKL